MKRHIYISLILIALATCSCKNDHFGEREQWPVSGTGNIDTDWFKSELDDNVPRFVWPDLSMRYDDGGVIHSTVRGSRQIRRFVDIATGNEVTFHYDDVDDQTNLISEPTLSVNGMIVSLRYARMENKKSGITWFSMSTPDGKNIVLVSEDQ